MEEDTGKGERKRVTIHGRPRKEQGEVNDNEREVCHKPVAVKRLVNNESSVFSSLHNSASSQRSLYK